MATEYEVTLGEITFLPKGDIIRVQYEIKKPGLPDFCAKGVSNFRTNTQAKVLIDSLVAVLEKVILGDTA